MSLHKVGTSMSQELFHSSWMSWIVSDHRPVHVGNYSWCFMLRGKRVIPSNYSRCKGPRGKRDVHCFTRPYSANHSFPLQEGDGHSLLGCDTLSALVSWASVQLTFSTGQVSAGLIQSTYRSCLGMQQKQRQSKISFFWQSVSVQGLCSIEKRLPKSSQDGMR